MCTPEPDDIASSVKLSQDFVDQFQTFTLPDVFKLFNGPSKPHFTVKWTLKNEIAPSDLYCYLSARFGSPNGMLTMMKEDDSDQLFHWDWVLKSGETYVMIQGMSYRTEVHIATDQILTEHDRLEFIQHIKSNFASVGKEMSVVRTNLENWLEFVNPYQRIRRTIYRLKGDLDELKIDSEPDQIKDMSDYDSVEEYSAAWEAQSVRYSRAFGLCFGIRSMLPIMAESYVNLLLYILMKPELKSDERLRESKFRQQIDVRIKSLSFDCNGFSNAIDYSHQSCKNYHSLVNERNDLLHGNVVIDKLKFNDIYFDGNTPIFKRYLTMWERAFVVEQNAVGLDKVNSELSIVEDLITYLNSCLDEKIRDSVLKMVAKYDLGIRTDNGGLGILFPDRLVDVVMK